MKTLHADERLMDSDAMRHAGVERSGFFNQQFFLRVFASVVLALAALLSGCIMPRGGPSLQEMADSAEQGGIALVAVTPELVLTSQHVSARRFPDAFVASPEVDYGRLAEGDVIQLKIWERDGLGVFGPDAAWTDLGEMTVDQAGDIVVPYVGKLRVKNLDESQLRSALLHRLSKVVVAPEVTIKTVRREGASVAVLGGLSKPGIYGIGPGAQRLVGVLAQAVPSQPNAFQTVVTVTRHGVMGRVRLADIYQDSALNVVLQAGDTITVEDADDRVTVLGAAGLQGRVKVSHQKYSVIEALADARGLDDGSADPRAIYVMSSAEAQRPANDSGRPTVYRFDFTKPQEMLLARQFLLHAGDVVYISDAPFTQTKKLLSAFSAATSSVRAGVDLAP